MGWMDPRVFNIHSEIKDSTNTHPHSYLITVTVLRWGAFDYLGSYVNQICFLKEKVLGVKSLPH